MEVLVLLALVLPVAILIIRRATPPPIKARLATLKSGIARKPVFIKDLATPGVHHLLVRGSRMPLASPSATITGRRYHNITSSRSGGQLWRTLRHNLSSGVVHPRHLHRYAAARRQAVRGLVADLRQQQQLSNGVALAAAESIRDAVFGLAATMCFGYGVDAGVVRAMADVQTEFILSFHALLTSAAPPGGPLFLALSRLIYRKRWNKVAMIRRKQEELYLPLINGCRRHRRDSDDDVTPSYVHTLVDLHVPVELEADDDHSSGGKLRKLEDGEIVGLCSEFLGQATEATAAAVQWIMANQIKHPSIQEAIRREIDAAVDADAEEVVGEELLGKLDHLKAVIMEVLRLHPTIMWVLRQVMDEDQVVHAGQRIPTGTEIFFSLEALGRDKAVWADPDEFKPERFHGCCTTKNLMSMAAEMKMMPFGVGKKMCPAISVSVLHISYFVANLVREFVWEEVEGEHAIQLQTDTSIFFFNRMARPLRAHLVPRRPEAKKICH